MPRLPENPCNPLRVLRRKLSKRGQRRMSQKDFSDLIAVPVDTIKSIENDRRDLDAVLSPILWRTCAKWNGRRWVCAFEWKEGTKEWVWSDGTRPFQYSVFARFDQDRVRRPSNALEQEVASWVRLRELFMLVPDSEWWLLMLRFQTFIEECWQLYDADKMQELLHSTGQQGGFGTSVAETDRYMRSYQEELAKHLTPMKRLKRGQALDRSISFHRAAIPKTPRSSRDQ